MLDDEANIPIDVHIELALATHRVRIWQGGKLSFDSTLTQEIVEAGMEQVFCVLTHGAGVQPGQRVLWLVPDAVPIYCRPITWVGIAVGS